MKCLLEEALATVESYDELDFNTPFYRSLLLEDVSDGIAELSFVECCGILSAYYGESGYYPQIRDDDIYRYLKECDDYLIPLGLLLLGAGKGEVLFTVCRAE